MGDIQHCHMLVDFIGNTGKCCGEEPKAITFCDRINMAVRSCAVKIFSVVVT